MRTLPVIDEKWASGGPFIGDKKYTTRVTVQMPWADLAGTGRDDHFLRKTNNAVGSSTNRGVPMRWWQRNDNSQTEMEIPNISNVTIDRSVDQDAASMTIRIKNQWMYVNGAAPDQSVMGQPGYFSPTRGDSLEANARWGHSPNDWNNVLVPNALIRVYVGFGAEDDTIANHVAAGDLCLYFVGLVDEVTINTEGSLEIRGRDMMKLLIDQQLFPPLVPETHYPLNYHRWSYEDKHVRNRGRNVPIAGTGSTSPGDKNTVYVDSSADRWYGSNASIYGHRGSHSTDDDPNSYALSVGNSAANRPFATDWWEYECGEDMNAVYVHPWQGGYVMYISVKVGGVWQTHPDPPTDDDGVIPYDASHLFATQSPAVDTGAGIAYVAKFIVPHETPGEYVLPQVYNAERVRVTFRNHVNSGLGTWKYRCGIREFQNRGAPTDSSGLGNSHTSTDPNVPTVWYDTYVQAGAARFDPDKIYSQGYLTVGRFGDHDSFGDARIRDETRAPHDFGDGVLNTPTAVAFTKSGNGYYVLNSGGSVACYGDAVWYGDPFTDDGFTAGNATGGFAWDISVTASGEGYYIAVSGQGIWGYGDASPHHTYFSVAPGNLITSVQAHPTGTGFWALRTDGKVFTSGDADHLGDWPTTGQEVLTQRSGGGEGLAAFINASEGAQCLRCTSSGDGYWILTTMGRVKPFGSAPDHGQTDKLDPHEQNLFVQCFWELFPVADDSGYLLLHASGRVDVCGDALWFGGPIPGMQRTLRMDGNYLDYVDIVKDLILWSGFLLYEPAWPSNQPAPAWAGLESTGVFAHDRLPDDMFDKRPVIDAITQLKEVVGYIVYVDHWGRFVFRSPNWWHIGNFDEDGYHQPVLWEIDEQLQLTDYTLSTADEPVRSSIIISSADPYADLSDTITSTYTPPSASRLRGIVKPAMWVNGHFISKEEQQIMAELIGLHISFQERVGQLSCYAHPGMEIDDQVRIYERQTGEVYVHYIRGINFSHDLDSGQCTTTLTTHWLAAGTDSGDVVGGETLPVSSLLAEKINAQQFGKFSRPPAQELGA